MTALDQKSPLTQRLAHNESIFESDRFMRLFRRTWQGTWIRELAERGRTKTQRFWLGFNAFLLDILQDSYIFQVLTVVHIWERSLRAQRHP